MLRSQARLDGSGDGLNSQSVLVYPDPWAPQANPYTRLIFDQLRRRGVRVRTYDPAVPGRNADILHVQWPESLLYHPLARRSALAARLLFANMLATARRVKASGGAVVWTVHNAKPHDGVCEAVRPHWVRFLSAFHALVDGFVCLSPSSQEETRRLVPELAAAAAAVIPHPHYGPVYRPHGERGAARLELGVDPAGILVASLGLLRRYKRVPELIDGFQAVRRPDESLIAGGACHDPALLREVQAAAAGIEGITLLTRDIPDARLAAIYKAADVAVFYSQGMLNSGSVIAALSLGCPVAAVDCGSLRDIEAVVGRDWLELLPEPPPPPALRAALDRLAGRRAFGAPDLSAMEPSRVAAQHLAFYRTLLARDSGAAA